jgi:hypothetical protein
MKPIAGELDSRKKIPSHITINTFLLLAPSHQSSTFSQKVSRLMNKKQIPCLKEIVLREAASVKVSADHFLFTRTTKRTRSDEKDKAEELAVSDGWVLMARPSKLQIIVVVSISIYIYNGSYVVKIVQFNKVIRIRLKCR